MNVLTAAVTHYRSSFCILLLVVLAGLYARQQMPLEINPNIPVPIVVVSVFLDGASPEDSARLLVKPLENELKSLDNVKEIIGVARESYAYVIIEFDAGFDADKAVVDVREAVDRSRSELPSEAEEPVVEEISADDTPTIVVTLTGANVAERQLFSTAQRLERAIENIPDVLEANIVGNREEVLEAVISPERLEYYNITSDDLISAIGRNHLLVPAGTLDSGGGRFSVKVPGLIETRKDLFQMPLKTTAEGTITLGDVAKIHRTFKDPERFTSVNGLPAMVVEVERRTGSNMVNVAEAVRVAVDSLKDQIPNQIGVGYVLDQSSFTRDMVDEMQGNILTAMALVMIIIIAAMGVKSGILVGLGIPFSLLFSAIIIFFNGFTFNFMVMFGMLLALGMLIDGAIVIIEFADRKMSEGISSKEAYQIAIKRMFWPVMASTLTTLAAFLPLIFWPGVAGKFMSYLPITVFAVLSGSLLYALFFAPVIGSILGSSPLDKEQQAHFQQLETTRPAELPGLTGTYARVLTGLVKRPITVSLVLLMCLVTIVITFQEFNNGVEFFTETEQKYGTVAIRAQGNLSVEEAKQLVLDVERRIVAIPGVAVTYTATGRGSAAQSNSRDEEKDQIGIMLVELDDPEHLDRSTLEVFELMREQTKDLPGIIVTPEPMDGGPPVGRPIHIQLESLDSDKLLMAARSLKQQLETHFPELRDITDSTPLPGIEWEFSVDREQASRTGVNVLEVGRTIQLLTNGIKVGEYRPDDAEDEVDIRVRFPRDSRGILAFDQLRVNTTEGAVPITGIVKRIAKPRVDKVERVDGIEVMSVSAAVNPSILVDDQLKAIRQWLEENPLDPAVTAVFRGANEEQEKSQAFLATAGAFALFLMFILLVTQFNSVYQSVLTLSAVIMSTIGVLLGLLISQATFSTILTGVGIVALAGIVVNNNIVLIDTYNYLRKQSPEVAPTIIVIMAAVQRLRPVFLTTITTILGLLPIATNMSIDLVSRSVVVGGVVASFWVPLASAIVWGLVFATLLTLLVTPVLLILPAHIQKLLIRRFR